MNTQTKHNLKIALTFLLIGIISTSIVWVYASPLSTFYISGGRYPQGDYSIWKEGSNFYAKTIYGQQPSWSGTTNASQLVQNVMNLIPTEWEPNHERGAIVTFGIGEFPLANISLPSYVTIKGASCGSAYSVGTIFNAESEGINMFNIIGNQSDKKTSITIENIRFNGGWKNARVIYAKYALYVHLYDCTFAGFANNVIYAESCWEWILFGNDFTHNGNLSLPLGTANIYLITGTENGTTNCNGWLITGNVFGASRATCLYAKDNPNKPASAYPFQSVFWVTNNWFHGYATDNSLRPDAYYAITGNFSELNFIGNNLVFSKQGFIKLGSASYSCIIEGNVFNNMIGYTIYFETNATGAQNTPRLGMHTLTDNVFRYNQIGETGEPTDGIVYFNSQNLEATNNIAYLKNATGVIVPLVKSGVNASGVQVYQYQFLRGEGTETYYSENRGNSTGTGGEQTIAHGLTGKPTLVLLSPPTTQAYESKIADSTNIYITADNGEDYYWYAEYHP